MGVADPYRGQTVKLRRPEAGASLAAEDLTGFLADKLSPIERPKALVFRVAYPRPPSEKSTRSYCCRRTPS